jgi:hypothetical protein
VPSSTRGTLKRNVSFNEEQPVEVSRPKTSPQVNTSEKSSLSGGATANPLMRSMPAQSTKKSAFDLDFDFDSLLKPKASAAKAPTAVAATAAGAAPGATASQKKSDSDWLENLSAVNPRGTQTTGPVAPRNPTGAGFMDNLKMTSAKDSMNSSFADSIENAESAVIKPAAVSNIQPLQFDQPKMKPKESSAPLEIEDSWLGSLITNKKPTKKVSHGLGGVLGC